MFWEQQNGMVYIMTGNFTTQKAKLVNIKLSSYKIIKFNLLLYMKPPP